MDQLLGESVVAVLGIKHPLKDNAKPPTVGELARAAKLKGTIEKRTKDLLAADKQGRQIGPPELPEYQEIQEQLARGLDPDVLTNVTVGIPRELQPVAAMTWTRGIAYLAAKLPRRLESRLTGAKLHDPSPGEWAEWGWAWRIANDPLLVFDLAGDGMLIGAEVMHLVAMFPAIYGAICGAIGDSLADRAAADADWQPVWWLRKQICTILQISPVSATLVADIEKAVQQSQAQTKQQPSNLKITNPDSTPMQRLAEK